MFFLKRPKPPLQRAIVLARETEDLVRAYWRDRAFVPSKKDIDRLKHVELMLFRNYRAVSRLVTRLECRFLGKPETRIHSWPDYS